MNTTNLSKQYFDKIYTSIARDVKSATEDLTELRVDNTKGQEEIGGILEKLRTIQSRFDDELDFLRHHVEWDRFTLAFFGDTNAGKSTIIESLRILFEEEGRQKLLSENAQQLEAYEAALALQVERAQQALQHAFKQHADEISLISKRVATLSALVKDEVASRTRRRLWLAGGGGLAAGVLITANLFLMLGR